MEEEEDDDEEEEEEDEEKPHEGGKQQSLVPGHVASESGKEISGMRRQKKKRGGAALVPRGGRPEDSQIALTPEQRQLRDKIEHIKEDSRSREDEHFKYAEHQKEFSNKQVQNSEGPGLKHLRHL